MDQTAEFSLDHETEVPRSACPSCGDAADRCSGPCAPKPGDITICIECRGVNVFAGDLTLREPTDAELVEMAGHPVLAALTNAIASVRR